MTTTLDSISKQLQDILDTLDAKLTLVNISPKQIVTPGGLSDIDRRLGLVQAGEFRSGNGLEPTQGFSGVRIGYPPFSYASQLWNIVGVENDVIQVGIRASDGKLIAGGGNVILSAEGIQMENSATSWFRFEDANGNYDTITIAADPNNDFEFTNLATSPDGTISFFLKNDSAVTRRVFYMRQHPAISDEFEVDFPANAGGGGRVGFGSDHFIDFLKSDGTGSATVYFNERNKDIDVIMEGSTAAINLISDAGLDAIGIGGAAESGYKLKVHGSVNLTTGSDYHVNGLSLSDMLDAVYAAIDAQVVAETNSNNIYMVNNPGGPSLFTATINGTPSGTSVVYNAPSAGTENAIVPVSTSQLAKMRLYNTTRGNSALISNVTTGTNTITLTATVPANWASGDTITVTSQTVSGGGFSWVDLEITSGPTTKTSIWFDSFCRSNTAGDTLRFHPFETLAASKISSCPVYVASTSVYATVPKWVKMTNNVFSIAWDGTFTGANDSIIIRELGYIK